MEASTEQNTPVPRFEPTKKKKPKKTLYWGVSLDAETTMNHPPIRKLLDDNPELVPLKKIHSTLLYVGRKNNENERVFLDIIAPRKSSDGCQEFVSPQRHEVDDRTRESNQTTDGNAPTADRSPKCKLLVTGHGCSKNALALLVAGIIFADDNTPVPSFARVQHVTIALANGTKAVDSVRALQGEGTVVIYDETLVLEGTLKRYFY